MSSVMEVNARQKYLLVHDFSFAPKYMGTVWFYFKSLFNVIDTMYILKNIFFIFVKVNFVRLLDGH